MMLDHSPLQYDNLTEGHAEGASDHGEGIQIRSRLGALDVGNSRVAHAKSLSERSLGYSLSEACHPDIFPDFWVQRWTISLVTHAASYKLLGKFSILVLKTADNT